MGWFSFLPSFKTHTDVPTLLPVTVVTDGETKTVTLKHFNLDDMCSNPTIFIHGKQKSGKETLLENLLTSMRKSNDKVIYLDRSGNYASEETGMDTETLYELMAKQHANATEGTMHNVIVVDLFARADRKREDATTQLVCEGRHYDMSYIYIDQDCTTKLRPTLRCNVDYAFIFPADTSADRETLWKQYAGFVPEFNVFETMMKEAAGHEHTCLVIDRRSRKDWTERIYYYKAM